MANHVTLLIGFNFDYDGTTNSIILNPIKGAVAYNATPFGGPFPIMPQFNVSPTGVENTTVTAAGGSPISTTASVSGGNLTVNIPSGLMAGPCTCQTTLIF